MHPFLTKLFFSRPLPPVRALGAVFWKGTQARQTSGRRPLTLLFWQPRWGPSVEEASSRVGHDPCPGPHSAPRVWGSVSHAPPRRP